MTTTPPEGPPGPADIRYALAATASPGPAARAAVQLGEALRALNRAVVGSTAPDELLDEVTAVVQGLTGRLAPLIASAWG